MSQRIFIQRSKHAARNMLWHLKSATVSFVGRIYLRLHGVRVGSRLHMESLPFCRCYENGRIEIGDNVTILNRLSENTAGITHRTSLVAGSGALLKIGNNVGISGAILDAQSSISIGDHCQLGANCSIFTSDYHPINALERREKRGDRVLTAPVVLEEDVWIGANAILLRGVTIGAGSIVGAGSVATRSVGRGEIVAGNPARFIRLVDAARTRDTQDSPLGQAAPDTTVETR